MSRLTKEQITALKMIERAKKHHRYAINALGRSYRSGKGTATAQKHRHDYERHSEIVEQALDALRAALNKEGQSDG